MQVKLRVHIAGFGPHIERTIDPMKRLRADKAYLLAFKEDDSSSVYLKKIIEDLKRQHITCKIIYVDLWNILECMEKFREIITKEQENEIFFNVSTGTKVVSMASMLACMIWGCEPYYAKTKYPEMKFPKKITPDEITDVMSVPIYQIIKPKPEHLKTLKIIQENKGRIKKKYLIIELKKQKIISPVQASSLSKAAEHGQLRSIIDPMLEMKYVNVEAAGRLSTVIITKQGQNALKIFGYN